MAGSNKHQRRRPLTRAEMQQRTREEVLDAAEGLFLTLGFRDTTVARIADEAGRTQGAIYANFASKETLCLAVIERRGLGIVNQSVAELSGPGASIDEKVASLLRIWHGLSGEAGLTTLVAEYLLATRTDAEQHALVASQLRIAKAAIGSAVSNDFGLSIDHDQVERLVLGVLTTVAGLSFGRATSLLTEHETGDVLEGTLRAWFASLEHLNQQR